MVLTIYRREQVVDALLGKAYGQLGARIGVRKAIRALAIRRSTPSGSTFKERCNIVEGMLLVFANALVQERRKVMQSNHLTLENFAAPQAWTETDDDCDTLQIKERDVAQRQGHNHVTLEVECSKHAAKVLSENAVLGIRPDLLGVVPLHV